MKWKLKQQADNSVLELYLYDTIQSSYYNLYGEKETSETSQEYFREQLGQYPNVNEIRIYINSNGGDVYEAYGMVSQLQRHQARKVCYVDGFACSAASLFLCIADYVYASKQATVMIHNMAALCYGNAEQLRKEADDLDVLMEANRQLYLGRMNITEEELITALNSETIYTAKQCLENGLVDEIVGESNVEEMEKVSQIKIDNLQAMIQRQQHMVNVLNQIRTTQQVPEKRKEPVPQTNELMAFLDKAFHIK